MTMKVFARGDVSKAAKMNSAIEIENDAYNLSERAELLENLPNFDIGILSIQDAAEMIACDMWYQGDIEVAGLDDDFDGDPRHPGVIAALTGEITLFVDRLCNAIEIGRLHVERMARNFDERIIAEETVIDCGALWAWLMERGYLPGTILHDWLEGEKEVSRRLCEESLWLRSASNRPVGIGLLYGLRNKERYIDETSHPQLLAAYKASCLENQHLRERLAIAEKAGPTRAETLASPRYRRTLLTVIAALCKSIGVNVAQRGASQRIKKMTEELGAPVNDETIRKILADIPDAVESRMK